MKKHLSQGVRNTLRPAVYKCARLSTRARAIFNPSQRKPDFFILGAQKAGTTTLYDLMVQHPKIKSARTKEIAYFDRYYNLGPRWYSANFPNESGVLTGEATPDYLYLDEARERIARDVPTAKFIVVLRNPVDRAISHYFHARRLGYEPLDMPQAFAAEADRINTSPDRYVGNSMEQRSARSAFSYQDRGFYAKQLEAWFKAFPKQQFFVVSSNRLFADPAAVTRDVFAFLGVDADVPLTHSIKNIGTYDSKISPELLDDLRQLYAQKTNG